MLSTAWLLLMLKIEKNYSPDHDCICLWGNYLIFSHRDVILLKNPCKFTQSRFYWNYFKGRQGCWVRAGHLHSDLECWGRGNKDNWDMDWLKGKADLHIKCVRVLCGHRIAILYEVWQLSAERTNSICLLSLKVSYKHLPQRGLAWSLDLNGGNTHHTL